jgi:hypothetical protein
MTYKNVILPVVLLRETLRVLRKITWIKGDQMTGWTKLHDEGLHNLYSLQSIIRITK